MVTIKEQGNLIMVITGNIEKPILKSDVRFQQNGEQISVNDFPVNFTSSFDYTELRDGAGGSFASSDLALNYLIDLL